jgi:two-component system response regulator HydG
MSPHSGERIGIIEDDLVVGGTLAHRLELEGYTPLWWHTGGEALKGLCAQRPDLVVCDILLPDMSGEDVFLQALPRLGGKPFLFVTGFGKIEDAVRLMKAGAVDYIVKPYALSDLLGRIARLLELQPRAAGDLGN